MSRPWATFLIVTFLFVEAAFAKPPVRKFDAPGAPPFKVLKTCKNPPLDVAQIQEPIFVHPLAAHGRICFLTG